MSLRQDATTKNWSADIRSRTMPRLHLSLNTKRKAEALTRHEALVKLVNEGYTDLVDRLRRRKLRVEQVAACVRDGRSFDALRETTAWPTLEDAAATYVQALFDHPRRAESTAVIARNELARITPYEWEGETLGSLPVDEIPAKAIDALAGHLGAQYAQNTTTDTIMRLAGLYSWLTKQEARAAREAGRGARPLHTPVDPETRPREKPARERFLLAGEIVRLAAATPEVERWPVLCGLLAGLRAGEVINLRHVDVDAETGIITVQKRPGWSPKRGKRREVPMCAELKAAHAVQVARYAGPVHLMTGATGSKRRHDALQGAFLTIVERAGMIPGQRDPEGVTFHTLRHTFASHMVMRGVDLYTVAQLLGDRMDTVEKVYARLAPDHKRQAVAKLAGLLDAVAETPDLDPPRVEQVTNSDTAFLPIDPLPHTGA